MVKTLRRLFRYSPNTTEPIQQQCAMDDLIEQNYSKLFICQTQIIIENGKYNFVNTCKRIFLNYTQGQIEYRSRIEK